MSLSRHSSGRQGIAYASISGFAVRGVAMVTIRFAAAP